MKQKNLFVALVLVAIGIMLKTPSLTNASVVRSLTMCFKIIVPSVFPFLVFSKILIGLDFAELVGRAFKGVMKPVFNVSGNGVSALVLGFLSGYPIGASVVCDLYRKKLISKTHAHRLLAFTNNCGPVFVIGAVGAGILGNADTGVLLYVVHIVSAIVTGIVFRFYKDKDCEEDIKNVEQVHEEKGIATIVTQSVKESAVTAINICAFVVTFALLCDFVKCFTNDKLGVFLSGLIEMSTGIAGLEKTGISYETQLVMTEFFLGFAGVSVHFQTLGVMDKSTLKIKPYIIGKTVQAVVGAVIMWGAIRCGINNLTVLKSTFVPMYVTEQNVVNVFSGALIYLGAVSVFLLVTYIIIKIISKIKGENENEKLFLHLQR